MLIAEGALAIAAALLVVSGVAKLIDPAPTAGALDAAGLPAQRSTVAVLGLVEILVGSAGLVFPGRWPPALVAAVYLGFAGFVGAALNGRFPLQSCGCFGRPDTPPTLVHLVANLGLAGAASARALRPGPPLTDRVLSDPGVGLVYLGFAGLGVYLVYLMLAELPRIRT